MNRECFERLYRTVGNISVLLYHMGESVLSETSFFFGTHTGPKRKQKQCLCKTWGDKQRVLWYFPKWPI